MQRNGVTWCRGDRPRHSAHPTSATRIGTGLVSTMPGQVNQRCMNIGLSIGVHTLTATMQPNVATLKESGVNAVVLGWNSVAAPAGTPKEVISYLNTNIRAVVESPDFKKRILDLGSEAKATTPANKSRKPANKSGSES